MIGSKDREEAKRLSGPPQPTEANQTPFDRDSVERIMLNQAGNLYSMAEHRRGKGRPQSVVPIRPNLVTSWRDAATDGGTKPLSEALEVMNSVLGTNFRHDRIAEWETGRHGRQPSPQVINYMLSIVVPVLLQGRGLDEQSAQEVLSQIQIVDSEKDR